MTDTTAGTGAERVEAGDWPSRVEVQRCCLLGNPAPKSKAHYQVDVYWSEFTSSDDGRVWPELVHSFWVRWSAIEALAQQVTDNVVTATEEAQKVGEAVPPALSFSLPRKLMGDGHDPAEIKKRQGELSEYLKAMRAWGAALPPDTTLWDLVRLVGPVKGFWATANAAGKDCIAPGEEPPLSEMFAPEGVPPIEVMIEVTYAPPQKAAQIKAVSAYDTQQVEELLSQLYQEFEGLQHVGLNTMQLVSADGTAFGENHTLRECGINSPTETGVVHKLTMEPISGVWRDLPPVDIVPIETQRARENRTQLEHHLRDYTATVLAHMRCDEEKQQGTAHHPGERQPTMFDLFSVLQQGCADQGQELFLFDSRDESEPGVVAGSPPASMLVDNTPHLSRLADNNAEVVQLVVGSLRPAPGTSADNQQMRHLCVKSPAEILGSAENLQQVRTCFRTYCAQAFEVAEDRITDIAISYEDSSYWISFPATGWTKEEKKRVYAAARFFRDNFREYIRLRVHPLFQKLQVDIASFDSRGHKDSWEGAKHSIGFPGHKEDYYQPAAGSTPMSYPCGGKMADQKWQRFGLNVRGKFKGGDRWLHPFNDSENWWRVYHGAEIGHQINSPMTSIIGSAVDETRREKPDEVFYNSSSGKLGPGVYVSPHLEYALCYSGGASIKMPNGKTRRYQLIFQCAARPCTRLRSGYSHEIYPMATKLQQHCSKRYPSREDTSRTMDKSNHGKAGDSHPSDSEWTFWSKDVRPYAVLLGDAAHLEQMFEMPNWLRNRYTHTDSDLGTLEPEPEPESEPSLEPAKAIDVYSGDVNLKNIVMLRQAPGTLAVRLHGSKHTQDLLKEVQGAEQMRVLADGSLPPVLVLTNQSTGKANNSQCADYILTEWKAALARVKKASPGAIVPGLVGGISPSWYVSNHKDAVALANPAVAVAQVDLPEGCQG